LKNSLLFFTFSKFAKYSIAALVGSIEVDERLSNLEIKIGTLNDLFEINIDHYDKVFIAFSFMSMQLNTIKDELKKVRNHFQNRVIIIGGGVHATAKPLSTIKLGFDYLIVGEGEDIFPDLLVHLLNNKSPDDLDGICFNDGGEIVFTKRKSFINLNKYPPFSIKYRIFAPIEISRGCGAGNCLYCMVPRIYGNKMRHRSIECIINTIKFAIKKGYNKVWFNSPNSFAYGSADGKTPNISKVVNLLKSIKQFKEIKQIFFGTFPSEVRPDSVNEDIVNEIIPYISNNSCIIGGQSGSNRILKILRRNHTMEDIEDAVDILLNYGITPKVDMIFGFYFEKPEDEEKTINFMKRIIKKGAIIHAHTFMPLPGSALEKAPPGNLSKNIKKFLGTWSRIGKVYGSWVYQEKIARELSNLKFF